MSQRAAFVLALGAWACSNVATDSGSGETPAPGGSGGSGVTGGSLGTAGSAVAPMGGSAAGGSAGAPITAGSGGMGATSGATGVGGSAAAEGGSAGSSETGGASGSAGIPGAGSDSGGTGTGGTGTGGTGTGGTAVGGTGGTGGQAPAFQKAAGTIQNTPQPSSVVGIPKSSWQQGLISPSMNVGHQINQPSVANGYLVIGGNEEFWIYDVSNAASPRQLSAFTTPGRTGAEAESHTVSYARYGNNFYVVTIGGRGIDTWDITSPSGPRHLGQLRVNGTNYGDYTEAIWGVSWQGQYIYVGATNNGIKVVDAANPSSLSIVAEVPTSQYGGISAGPVDAIGNVLVVMTPKESGGVATLDISNPTAPTRLASFTAPKSYIGQFYRHWVFLITPNRAWDVLTNPRNIGSGTAPIGTLNTEGAEYMSFGDDYMFLGHVRAEIGGTPGASKISVSDPRSMRVVDRVWGRQDRNGKNDDQFTVALGNLIVLGDDQAPFAGWVIAAHQTDPDTKAPLVDTVIPNNQATAVSTKSRVGVSFSDNIDIATVNAASFIVRPVGGQALAGKFGVRMGVVNFDPDQDLQPGTTYEVVLPRGGVADLVGNTLTTAWTSTFTTQ